MQHKSVSSSGAGRSGKTWHGHDEMLMMMMMMMMTVVTRAIVMLLWMVSIIINTIMTIRCY